ncbi:MAG TPA: thiamine pyrophosphate-dependent dehydrogenase E1 component subunit alpha [Chloroflexota bacterium]|jgi:pyruvate dehydrogenase E1 component alpha subunit
MQAQAQALKGEQLVELFQRALLIRRVEEQVAAMIGQDFGGSTHFCMGQELTAVVACAALEPDDWVFTTHRNRAHVLARGAEPRRVLAELLGKAEGLSGGKAGSFHIADPTRNMPVASAMVAGSLPVAAGAALGAKLEQRGRVALTFFGDGAINEGGFHEAVNLAQLWTLPVIFLCENNDAVPYDPAGSGLATRDIAQYVAGYNLPSTPVDGSDVQAVWAAVSAAVARARAGEGPSFVEARTHRGPMNQTVAPSLPGGPLDLAALDGDGAGRPMPAWDAVDPLRKLARTLVAQGTLDRQRLAALDAEAQQTVREAAEFARAAPYPPLEAALTDVYA